MEESLEGSPHSTADRSYARCIRDYTATGNTELTLKVGDIVRLIAFDQGTLAAARTTFRWPFTWFPVAIFHISFSNCVKVALFDMFLSGYRG